MKVTTTVITKEIFKQKNSLITVVITVVLSIIFLLGSVKYLLPSFEEQIMSNTVDSAKRVSNYLINLYEKEKDFSIMADIKKDLGLVKIKFFDKKGKTIYSTDKEDIEVMNENDYFHNIVAKGEIYYQIVKKSVTIDGSFQIKEVDVAEVYVPIMKDEKFQYAFEVYYDITKEQEQFDKLIFKVNVINYLVILLVFTIVFIRLYSSTKNILKEQSFQKKLREEKDKFRSLLNLQDNIICVVDRKEISFANKKFFEFLGYKELKEFKKHHKSICELFIENDRFFHLGKIDEDQNWIDEIQKYPHSDRIVSILGNDFKPHAFSVSINKFNEDMVIISFSDISQTMLEYIKMEEKTIHDKLTGAFNREFFEQNYRRLINEYHTVDSKLAIALIDIDHFKSVNDTYGHDVGDAVLIHFVKTVQKFSREEDIFIRWGGEEFILILKVHSKEDLEKALEHIRRVIEITEFPTVGQKTCSIGGTIYTSGEDIISTIKRADEAVYDAKAAGRNKGIIN